MDRNLLNAEQHAELIDMHPAWDVGDTAMSRTFTFGDFGESMGFVNRVALAAERVDHHPDIDIRWNRVTLTLSTHSEGGLTGLDRDLAEAFDRFA
jgi:4a-hydroxytetrahydrobiopterin dehydratase